MSALKRIAAALALGAIAATGIAAAGPVTGVLADDGVIHGYGAVSGAAHLLADNGVLHGNGVGGSDSVRILADDGVIASRN